MDELGFHALYERYSRDVYRFAYYLSGDPSRAEDVAAETFLRAWTSFDRIRTATVKAFLFSIARNLVREQQRKGAHAPESLGEPSDPRPGPEAQAGGRIELRALLRALQRLPESDRAVLLMRAQDGMAHEEIARALGLSLVAVRVKLHRARLALDGLRIREERQP